MVAAHARGLQGALNEVPGQAADLEVHLEAGDALAGAADLEVHIAAVVLGTQNIGDEHLLGEVRGGEEAHGDARDRRAQRHARIHQRQAATADGGHRGGAIRAHNLAHHAHRVGIILRQHLGQRTLGQGTVTNLAAAGRAQAAHFARAVGREVVVEDEALGLRPAGHRVELLGILGGAEGDGGQVLRLATVEDRRAVQTRQHANLRGKRANLVLGAPVDTLAALEEVRAHRLNLQRVEEVNELHIVDDPVATLVLAILLLAGGEKLIADGLDGALALELAGDNQRIGQLGTAQATDEVHLLRILRLILDHLVRLAQGAAHLNLQVDNLLDLLVGALHRGQEVRLGDLRGRAFHHQELAAQAGIEQVEIRLGTLLVRGVDDPLALDAPNAHAANRAHKRNIRDVQRGRSGIHRQHIALVLPIAGDEHRVDLHIIIVTIGEERADRTIAHTRGEDFLLRGARLALEEAPGEAPGRVILLAILALQREEVDPFARLIGARHGRKDRRIAHRHNDRTRGLLRQQPRLNRELLAGNLRREDLTVLHCLHFLNRESWPERTHCHPVRGISNHTSFQGPIVSNPPQPTQPPFARIL